MATPIAAGPLDRRVVRLRLTPHQKIMRAAKRRTGLRLTAAEIFALSCDSAIATRGELDDEGRDEDFWGPNGVGTAMSDLAVI